MGVRHGLGARVGAGVDFRLTDGRFVDATTWFLIIRAAVKYEPSVWIGTSPGTGG